MEKALAGVPQATYVMPEGVVIAVVDPLTGLRLPENSDGITEFFYPEFLPAREESETPAEESWP